MSNIEHLYISTIDDGKQKDNPRFHTAAKFLEAVVATTSLRLLSVLYIPLDTQSFGLLLEKCRLAKEAGLTEFWQVLQNYGMGMM